MDTRARERVFGFSGPNMSAGNLLGRRSLQQLCAFNTMAGNPGSMQLYHVIYVTRGIA